MEFNSLEVMMLITGLSAILVLGFFIRKQVLRLSWKKDLQKNLEGIISVINFVPYKTEYFAKKVLALDKENRKLVYLDHFNDLNNVIIETDRLAECRLVTKILCVKIDLIFKDPDKQTRSIIFYQKFVNPEFSRGSLTVKARQWKQLLTQELLETEMVPEIQ